MFEFNNIHHNKIQTVKTKSKYSHYKLLLQSILRIFKFGASGRNRTGTPVKARDFKSLVSTYFTIKAGFKTLL